LRQENDETAGATKIAKLHQHPSNRKQYMPDMTGRSFLLSCKTTDECFRLSAFVKRFLKKEKEKLEALIHEE
jgi:hypothetical protein